jgi:lantibiotic modifying enzyme
MAADERLARILEIEAFIESCRIDGDHGALWHRTPEGGGSPHSLYHGSAGVVLFYLELHRATGDSRHLDVAISGADELLASVHRRDHASIAIYSGLPGDLFVLNEVAKATGLDRFHTGPTAVVQQMLDRSESLGAGIGWIEPMPFSDITGITGERELLDLSVGAAGAGLGLLYAHRQHLHDRALAAATATADRLLEVAVQTPDGPNWPMMADMPFAFTAPNFAHGAAGVGYFLADLFRSTDDQRYLDTAIAAAGFVEAHASATSDDGVLVCHTEEQPDLYYLGVCHGPPGTGRLMYLLHEITGDDRWLDWLRANLRGLLATGAPETRSRGLWHNFGQCCGDAGLGDYALSLGQATGDAHCLALAERIEAVIMDASEVDDGRRWWSQAEHRNRPDLVESQTGYMQGAAGIASFLLHLSTIGEHPTSKISLPDSPFVR